MRGLLGRIGEWSVTHPAAAIAGVISIVAIVGVVGALRLTPDAGTDKLVDHGSPAYGGTVEFRERFGDDAIVVLSQGPLQEQLLTEDINRLLAFETCLAGRPEPSIGDYAAEPCRRLGELGAIRAVFGPATFLAEAASRASDVFAQQAQQFQSATPEEQQAALQQFAETGLSPLSLIQGITINNAEFVSTIVFDRTREGNPPKSKFGYLFPSAEAALISVRLRPDLSTEDRREAIKLIREAAGEDVFQLRETGKSAAYTVSGVPVVVEGLADELGGEIAVLFGAALAIMALVLLVAFGPPLRLLPLLTAIAAAGFAFGLLSLLGGSLTMASVAVLPVVIGLAVDYAIQLQARFREAAANGARPPAAAVTAAVRGGPVIATAALATAVGFLALTLSPIPMVREFAIALVAGIAAALLISLTAGLAALSMTTPRAAGRSGMAERAAARWPDLGDASARVASGWSRLRGGLASVGSRILAMTISRPGRILFCAAALAICGWVFGSGTKVVSDIRELVPGDLPALESVDTLQQATGVSGSIDVMVSGDVTSPAGIAWMSDFKQRVLTEHGFEGEAPSCLDDDPELCPGPALSDLFDLDSGKRPKADRIAAVLGAIPPYFSQAILSRGDPDVATISLLIPVMALDEQAQLIDEIRAELDPPKGITAEVVGLPVLAADANEELTDSRHWLTIAGLLAVALVLLAVYRSFPRALVPLLPIALATGWTALVLELVAIPLNPMSATLGALVIAVATEFSVILSARFREEREGGFSVGEALRRTYARTGTAVLASGITSIAGFGVLSLSGITMLRDFGIVTVIDLAIALAGVMIVLPATLVWAESGFRPLRVPSRKRGVAEGRATADPDAA